MCTLTVEEKATLGGSHNCSLRPNPRRVGNTTPCPRLEAGKISVAPCSNASQKPCQVLTLQIFPNIRQ
jgi:hypothetical protein